MIVSAADAELTFNGACAEVLGEGHGLGRGRSLMNATVLFAWEQSVLRIVL